MSSDENRSENNTISLSVRRKAATLAILVGMTIFVSGVIGKVIDRLF